MGVGVRGRVGGRGRGRVRFRVSEVPVRAVGEHGGDVDEGAADLPHLVREMWGEMGRYGEI